MVKLEMFTRIYGMEERKGIPGNIQSHPPGLRSIWISRDSKGSCPSLMAGFT
jgi:hypothetical protein